ncbi:MAG: sugar transferase [Chitinophagaceae bacterium]|jgi:exopolysaccharide production protein ExoY|nr:MAG: sugar transferase [Chitinophagaceae bacterium]
MKNGSGVEADRLNAWAGNPPAGTFFKVHSSALKRAMDLVIAFTVLAFVAPIFLIVYALIKIFDPGPALFSHLRVGRDGRMFTVYKFRTMRVDAQERLEEVLTSDPKAAAEWAEFQKLKNDPRVTVIGRILRRTSIDELPQLLNIVRGEMSVIGPRPVTSGEIHRYGAEYPYYTAVRPGVLGLWQVKGRNKLTYPERVAYDVQYVKTWSIWQDIKIMLVAIPVVLLGLGAY